MFAAKLSKLVYTASDHPDSLSEMEEFDRLILLIRKLYQILDGQHILSRVTVCLHYRSRRGLIALDKAAAGCDAAMLRAQRWRIYTQIAERLAGSGGGFTVTAESVSAACPELEATLSRACPPHRHLFRFRASTGISGRRAGRNTSRPGCRIGSFRQKTNQNQYRSESGTLSGIPPDRRPESNPPAVFPAAKPINTRASRPSNPPRMPHQSVPSENR